MVTTRQWRFCSRQCCTGAVLLELVVAISILGVAVIPLGFLMAQEHQLCRAYYYRSVAMEIVDGEMEALVAGEWRAFQQGEQPYPVRADAAKNLPPGRFVLTLREKHAKLQWLPEKPGKGGAVVREALVR